MRKLVLLLIVVPICLFASPGCGSNQATFDNNDSRKIDSYIKVQKLNNHALLVNFGYDAISAIETDSGIVIIDAGISTELTSRYRKLVENEFRKDDFIYVINTHGHNDHTGGNSVFPGARILGHKNIRKDLSETLINPVGYLNKLRNIIDDYDQKLQQSSPGTNDYDDAFTQKIRYLGEFSDIKRGIAVRMADITFIDSITITAGNTSFEMIWFGNAHSASDIVIYIPEDKMLFTGDLFSRYGRPAFNLSSSEDLEVWKQSVRWIQKRTGNIEKIIDGHGQILTPEDLSQFNNKILTLGPVRNL